MSKFLIYGGSNISPPFWKSFADHVGSRTGSEFSVVCFDSIKADDYRNQGFSVSCLEHVLRSYGQHDSDKTDVMTFLRQFEKETGASLMDLIQTDRHLGRGHFTSGTRHPRSDLSDMRNYADTARLVKKYILRFDDLLTDLSPNVILMGGVASLSTKLLCVCARRHGVKIRIIRSARVGNRYLWTINEFSEAPQIAGAFKTQTPDKETIDSTYTQYKKTRDKFTRYLSLEGVAVSCFHDIKQYIGNYLYREDRKPSSYKLTSNLRLSWNRFRDYRLLMQVISDKKDLRSDDYFYYPLQVEPEASLMTFSPEFNNQQALIDATSKSLPAGYKILVKEHIPAIGRRPAGFYRWIDELANVKFVSPHSDGRRLAQNSIATVTITSTAGLEASVDGVPVITPGQYNMYNILDHVYQTTDFSEIRCIIHKLVDIHENNLDVVHTRRRDGQRLLSAIKQVSVDLGNDTSLTDGTSPSDQTVESLCESFISSLNLDDPTAHSSMS